MKWSLHLIIKRWRLSLRGATGWITLIKVILFEAVQQIYHHDGSLANSCPLVSVNLASLNILKHLADCWDNLFFENSADFDKVDKNRFGLVKDHAKNFEEGTFRVTRWLKIPNVLVWDLADNAGFLFLGLKFVTLLMDEKSCG